MDITLYKLNSDMAQTKTAFSVIHDNLDTIRLDINSTQTNVKHMNVSVEVLNDSVERLSAFVTRVERMMPSGLSTMPMMSTDGVAEPVKTYPKSE